MRSLILLLSLVASSSCASIVSRSIYPVTFESIPAGASIVIRDKSGNVIYTGTSPTTLTLDASQGFFSSARYDVDASLPGYRDGRASHKAGLDGWYIGNIVFGGIIGFLIVDPASGAMWKLGNRVTVNLEPSTETSFEGAQSSLAPADPHADA